MSLRTRVTALSELPKLQGDAAELSFAADASQSLDDDSAGLSDVPFSHHSGFVGLALMLMLLSSLITWGIMKCRLLRQTAVRRREGAGGGSFQHKHKALAGRPLPSNDELGEAAGDDCPICMEKSANMVFTSCRHVFCEDCIISTWKNRNFPQRCICPLCRESIYTLFPLGPAPAHAPVSVSICEEGQGQGALSVSVGGNGDGDRDGDSSSSVTSSCCCSSSSLLFSIQDCYHSFIAGYFPQYVGEHCMSIRSSSHSHRHRHNQALPQARVSHAIAEYNKLSTEGVESVVGASGAGTAGAGWCSLTFLRTWGNFLADSPLLLRSILLIIQYDVRSGCLICYKIFLSIRFLLSLAGTFIYLYIPDDILPEQSSPGWLWLGYLDDAFVCIALLLVVLSLFREIYLSSTSLRAQAVNV